MVFPNSSRDDSNEGHGGASSSPLWLWEGVSGGERPWHGGTS